MAQQLRDVPVWRSVPVIIVAGCLIAMLSFGPRASLGLFLAPMTEARGWSREAFALALAIQNLMWGAGQPIFGAIADRWGTARVLTFGAVIYALGLYGMAYAENPLWLHVWAGVAVGLGMAAASFSLVLAAFGRSVSPAKRTVAFGIGTAAGSFGQFLFAPLGQAFIENFGWLQALVIMAVLVLSIIPLSVALIGKPEPSGATGPEQSILDALGEAFAHRSYVLLVFGFFVCGFHVAFIAVHLPPFITDVGIDARWGAWAIAIIGLFNIIGSFASGIISGRYSKPYVLSLIYFLRAIVFALFVLLPPTPLTILVFSATLGLLWLSTVPPTSALVAIMFGPRYMATLFGFVFFSHQIGAFLGVWLGGRLYDTTGSYDVVWWLSVALGVFAAIVHWPIQERPVPRLEAAE